MAFVVVALLGAVISVLTLWLAFHVLRVLLRVLRRAFSSRQKRHDPPHIASTEIPAPSPLQVIKGDLTANLHGEEERLEAASELLEVPQNVKVAVTRSRTIEHIVEIQWKDSKEFGLDAGVRPILSASLRGVIERVQGRTYQQTETVEYRIELDGNAGVRYRLSWTDVWLRGVAEFRTGKWRRRTVLIPFRFRDRTELQVQPLSKGNGP